MTVERTFRRDAAVGRVTSRSRVMWVLSPTSKRHLAIRLQQHEVSDGWSGFALKNPLVLCGARLQGVLTSNVWETLPQDVCGICKQLVESLADELGPWCIEEFNVIGPFGAQESFRRIVRSDAQ